MHGVIYFKACDVSLLHTCLILSTQSVLTLEDRKEVGVMQWRPYEATDMMET